MRFLKYPPVKLTAWRVAILATLVFAPGEGTAQESKMPIVLVDGALFARRTLDVEGSVSKYQEVEVGRLERSADQIGVEVTLYNFDDQGAASDTLMSTIWCTDQAVDMVMNFLAVVDPKGSRVRLRMVGGEIAYPIGPGGVGALADVNLNAKVEEGVLGLLGAKSRLSLKNRVLLPVSDGPELTSYSINETLLLRAYVLGIKVKEQVFQIETTIIPGQGLMQQVVTAPDGSSVRLERLN